MTGYKYFKGVTSTGHFVLMHDPLGPPNIVYLAWHPDRHGGYLISVHENGYSNVILSRPRTWEGDIEEVVNKYKVWAEITEEEAHVLLDKYWKYSENR